MKKILKYSFALIIGLITAIIILYWTPDIPRHQLVQKYAVGASDFLPLPSGANAHFRKQGNEDGEVLVLLHGSNSSLHAWEDWVNELSGDHLIYTVDLPGHGLTGPTPADDYSYAGMVDFVKEFTSELGLNEFILGGSSMGGGISLAYTVKHPSDVSALILVDPSGVKAPDGAKSDPPLAFKLAGRWYTDWILLNITPRSIVEQGATKGFVDQSKITDVMVDRYWELARLPGNRAATSKRFRSYRENSDKEVAVENVTAPTLILWGEEDLIIPIEAGKEMHKRLPNSTFVAFPNVGHVPMEEIPTQSAVIAKDFITALPN